MSEPRPTPPPDANTRDNPSPSGHPPHGAEPEPWPISWVVIAILVYLLCQVTWIAFHD